MLLGFIDETDVVVVAVAVLGILLALLRKPIAAINIWMGNKLHRSDPYDEDDQRLTEIGHAIAGLVIAAVAIYAVVRRHA